MTEALPPAESARIRDTVPAGNEFEVLGAGTVLLRIHPLGGDHPSAWNEFRAWGPTSARFDHHTPPQGEHPTRRILYATSGEAAFVAALAETFQDDNNTVGPLDLTSHRPAATAFALAAPVRLLNLDSGWVTRAGGNQAIRTGRRSRAREWARTIYWHHQDVDGLAYGSSVWGPGRCVVLWERAEDAMPERPSAFRLLDDPSLEVPLAGAAEELGTVIV